MPAQPGALTRYGQAVQSDEGCGEDDEQEPESWQRRRSSPSTPHPSHAVQSPATTGGSGGSRCRRRARLTARRRSACAYRVGAGGSPPVSRTVTMMPRASASILMHDLVRGAFKRGQPRGEPVDHRGPLAVGERKRTDRVFERRGD